MEASARPDNGFAVVALVLGIAALLPFYGIAAVPFAILFGILGRRRAAHGAPSRGLAWAGFWLGIAGAIENLFFVLFVVAV